MACITYKQIGGSKQYVQPGAIGIFSVLCSLNHAVLGEKNCIGKIVIVQYMCSMCCMITYGMRRPPNVYCFQNECDKLTCAHTLLTLLIDLMEETHTDGMLFKRFMLKECVIYTESNFLSRRRERALLH